MLIEFKQPYWLKYKWNIDFNKSINNPLKGSKTVDFFEKKDTELLNFLYENYYTVSCKFKLNKNSNNSKRSGIFGKAGQNYGLYFDYSLDSLIFEYSTKNNGIVVLPINKVNGEKIHNFIHIIVMKKLDSILFYHNDELIYEHVSNDILIDFYQNKPIFIGCLSPTTSDENDRCFCEMEIEHFSITYGDLDINSILEISNIPPYKLCLNKNYDNLKCFFDFNQKSYNNKISDESKYQNLIESVPKFLIK